MAHNVRVNVDDFALEDGVHNTGDVVKVSDDEFTALTSAGRFTDGDLTDQGVVPDDAGDAVYVEGTAPALTSTDAAGATPTQAEFNALRADVVALRAALIGTGKPFAS